MEEFTKYCALIRNFDLKDCEGLPGIESFLKEGFKVDDMIDRADKIASLEAVSAAAYSPMALGFGLLDSFAILPKVNIDNKRFHSMDMAYIHELIEDLKNYQNHVRKLTAAIDEIGLKAREEADCLNDLHDYFVDGIDDLKSILERKGEDWNRYSQSEKMQIARAIQRAQLITILFPHLLNDKGEVSEDREKAIEKATKALAFRDA